MAKKKAKRLKATSAKVRPRRYRVLSLDGGGIRGVITAVWLDRIEHELGSPIGRSVDLIAGTSTGSILACALSHGLPASRIVQLYVENGRKVFPGASRRRWDRIWRTFSQGPSAPKYNDDGLAKVLQDEFGTDLRFGELATPTLVTSYNTLNRTALVFKSFKPEHGKLRTWEIAKASSSAPTYFPAHIMSVDGAKLPLIDGGVVANSPTACAIAEAVRINASKKTGLSISDLNVLSFGTGELTRPITIDDATEWGAIEWAIPVIDVLMDGAADAVDYIARHLIPDDQYVRMQTRLTRGFDDMDDASATNINALVALAQDHLNSSEGRGQLRSALELLST